MQYSPTAAQARTLSTEELRENFLLTGLFVEGRVTMRVIDLDRAGIGGAVPTTGGLRLEVPDELRAEFFAERRELGVLNIGGDGKVTVDKDVFALSARDVVYVGRGSREIMFESKEASHPARFYIVSYPAHADYPTTLVRAADVTGNEIGSAERANRRRIARYIHREGVRSSQLVMGVTVLEPGSVWNTMPAHTHSRRSEVYMYFDLPADAMVVHLMGEPTELRAMIVRDGDVALSPGWSVHCGCGTSSYSFCWAMGGENQDYGDMDPVPVESMR
jgi:4-deoxy-L-threo-5-hexosulose-uronate ketol-isomerase